jgi:DNA-binding NarL/FixJ family response regulator
MVNPPVRVLLIEDNLGDARLVMEFLDEAPDARFVLQGVRRLSEGLDRLATEQIDVVLLDLNLPDSDGWDTLLAVRTAAPRVPVVVLTTMDETAGPTAVQAGAQDYLPKGSFNANLLARSLRYAVERQLLLNQLERRHAKEQESRELQLLQAIAGTTDSAVGSRLFGARSLREAAGPVFAKIAHRYGEVLAEAVRSDTEELPPALIEELDRIAGGLTVLHASPRDAVELHAAAMTIKDRFLRREEIGKYLERGRQTLLELISQLAAHYRTYQVTTRETLDT